MGLEEGEKKVGRKAIEEDFEYVTWMIFQRGRKVTGVQHAQDIETIREWNGVNNVESAFQAVPHQDFPV